MGQSFVNISLTVLVCRNISLIKLVLKYLIREYYSHKGKISGRICNNLFKNMRDCPLWCAENEEASNVVQGDAGIAGDAPGSRLNPESLLAQCTALLERGQRAQFLHAALGLLVAPLSTRVTAQQLLGFCVPIHYFSSIISIPLLTLNFCFC